MKSLYVIGVGLIGGSFALDVKKAYTDCNIYGIDNNEANLEEALSLDIIDNKATLSDVTNADIVILAIPVDATLSVLPQVLDLISDDALVIDCLLYTSDAADE